MRPSGSGATGKGMGPAADCCVRRKGGAILGPSGRPEGGRLWPAPVLPSVSYQPGDAPCWEDSARRPDSASALRVCCGTRPAGWFCNASAPSGFGSRCRGWTATPLVASLLPLAVRAGAPAFAGLVGIRKVTLTARPHGQAVGDPAAARLRRRRHRATHTGEPPVAAASWESSGLELRSL
jgi:hypothetical protein